MVQLVFIESEASTIRGGHLNSENIVKLNFFVSVGLKSAIRQEL